MADTKLSDLTALTGANVALTDLIYIVDVTAGTAGSKSITIQELLVALEANLVASIKRTAGTTVSLTVDTVGNIANCTVLDLREYAHGMIHVPSASSVTSLVPYVCDTSTGTYTPANDEESGAVSLTVAASKSYQFPSALSGAKYIKFTANASGTIKVDPKS
jgi:hypothetical protein